MKKLAPISVFQHRTVTETLTSAEKSGRAALVSANQRQPAPSILALLLALAIFDLIDSPPHSFFRIFPALSSADQRCRALGTEMY